MSSTGRGTQRRDRDAYSTPTWCTEAIVREIVWGTIPVIYEPCAGDGAICDVLNKLTDGVVFAADINPDCRMGGGEDFLKNNEEVRYDFIITNPPFSLAQEFVDRSLALANCVVMLLPINFLGSQKRQEWWQTRKPTAFHILSKRPSFTGSGTDSNEYAWYVWDSTGRQKVGWHWV